MAVSHQNGLVSQMLPDNHHAHQFHQLQSVWRDCSVLNQKFEKTDILRARNGHIWQNFVLPLYIKLSNVFIRITVSLKFKSLKSGKFWKGWDEFPKFKFPVPPPPPPPPPHAIDFATVSWCWEVKIPNYSIRENFTIEKSNFTNVSSLFVTLWSGKLFLR